MFKTYAQLAELLKPFRKKFYLFLLIVLVYEAAQVVNSYILTGAIRMYQNSASTWVWVGFFVALEVFDTLFRLNDGLLDWHIVSKLLFPIAKHVDMLVLKVFLSQDAAWHQRNNSGVLIGKADNGKRKVEEVADMMAWEFIPTSMQAILTLPPLLYFSPLIAGITLASLALFIAVTKRGEDFRLPMRVERHNLYEELWQSTEEAVKAHETLSIYGQVDRTIAEHDATNDRITEIGNTEARKTIFRYNAIRSAVIQNTSRLVLGVLMWQVYHKTITVAEVFFVYTLSERLLGSFWRFARMIRRVGECSEGINRLHRLSKEQPEIVDGPETRHNLVVPRHLTVEFRDVTFCYPGIAREAISNVSLVVNDGEQVAIVGPSGSGKTTLRRLLLRLFEVTSGEILIGGIPIKQWPLETLRSLFAYVPQGDEVFIFDSDIEQNIRLSRPEATEAEVAVAARQAGLSQFIESLPDGYKTKVGEKGMKLSGGQKQRMALARAIVSGRRFLILDEATSSVDALTEQEIQHELKEVLKGVTSIVIAHRMPTIWGADKIVVMNNGGKEAEGTHHVLMTETDGIYHRMVSLQTIHEHLT